MNINTSPVPSRISWKGSHNNKFEMRVERYEFPEIFKGYDANWLTISIDAQNDEGEWQRHSPCILTWELVWLRRWLSGIIDGAMENIELSFMETALRFIYIAKSNDFYHFSIVLKRGLSLHDEYPSIIHLNISAAEYKSALSYIDAAIDGFPVRDVKLKQWEQAGPKEWQE